MSEWSAEAAAEQSWESETAEGTPPAGYELLEKLGSNDIGDVYLARHRESGAELALRVLNTDAAATPGGTEALGEMIELAGNVVHPHLGQQLGFDDSASPTIVSEYVAGCSLQEIMKERGAAPSAAVVDLGVRLCGALQAAHDAGLAHGRVHAGNVLLEKETLRWVLLDLGHRYAVEDLDQPYDLYSLGSLLYELATGHSAFDQDGPPADPRTFAPKLSEKLAGVLLRAVDPNPENWFESAGAFAEALKNV